MYKLKKNEVTLVVDAILSSGLQKKAENQNDKDCAADPIYCILLYPEKAFATTVKKLNKLLKAEYGWTKKTEFMKQLKVDLDRQAWLYLQYAFFCKLMNLSCLQKKIERYWLEKYKREEYRFSKFVERMEEIILLSLALSSNQFSAHTIIQVTMDCILRAYIDPFGKMEWHIAPFREAGFYTEKVETTEPKPE